MRCHARFVSVALGLAIAAVLASACTKGSSSGNQGTETTTTAAGNSMMMSIGDAAHGKKVFAENCTSCHGATGREGGIGPSLSNERIRKNNSATIAWIKNPQPPMPKLWPGKLNDKDVADVAAYVQSL